MRLTDVLIWIPNKQRPTSGSKAEWKRGPYVQVKGLSELKEGRKPAICQLKCSQGKLFWVANSVTSLNMDAQKKGLR